MSRHGAPRNVPASVKQRLLNLSQERQEEFNYLAVAYALERLLYRLSVSPFADRFVLKGAALFRIWLAVMHRNTLDLDLLGRGFHSVSEVEDVFRQAAALTVGADGMEYLPETVTGSEIREGALYHGIRIRMGSRLGTLRLTLHVDIGLGDGVVPAPEMVEYPSLLSFPSACVKAYTRYTVVAEKFEAMVVLDLTNSRMKDFYDVWVLAREFSFDGATLARAVSSTFAARRTPIPAQAPLALTAEFSEYPAKAVQWRAFLRRNRLDTGTTLAVAVGLLAAFLGPVTTALVQGQDFAGYEWPPGGPWRQPVRQAR